MSRAILRLSICLVLLVCAAAAQGPQSASKDSARFKELEFLLGDWTAASGSGEPGTATAGAASFQLELNGQVLVRHSYAEYGKGNRHDDLLYVYRDTASAPLRAIYFDSEGHVIHYSVTSSGDSATFESEASQPGPRYRLSYQSMGKTLNGKFEMAMPGSEEYKTYLAWTSVKK